MTEERSGPVRGQEMFGGKWFTERGQEGKQRGRDLRGVHCNRYSGKHGLGEEVQEVWASASRGVVSGGAGP